MTRRSFNDLQAFVAVARERSFTRAAAQLGVSTSALSHAMRGLEDRLGIRLLARTTRSLVATEAGERLLATIGPHFDGIAAGVAALALLRDQPAGTIRLTTGLHAANTIVAPALKDLLPRYPDIHVEISVDGGFVDIVAERFDAGIRLGETIALDMIAVRIGPDMRMAAVAAPSYLADHAMPEVPSDLAGHRCINLRFPTYGNLYAWEFENDGRAVAVRVDGPLTVNNIGLARQAALDGLGIAFLLEDEVREHLDNGQLVRLLAPWCPPFSGYHLYYPSRRQQSLAFKLFVEALKSRGLR